MTSTVVFAAWFYYNFIVKFLILILQQPDVIPEVGNSVTLASENGDEIYHKDEIPLPVSDPPHSNMPSDTPHSNLPSDTPHSNLPSDMPHSNLPSDMPHSNLPSVMPPVLRATPPSLPDVSRDQPPHPNPDILSLVTRLSDIGHENKDGRPAANDTHPTLTRDPPPYPYPAPLNPVMLTSEKEQDANNNRKTPLLNLLVSLTFK